MLTLVNLTTRFSSRLFQSIVWLQKGQIFLVERIEVEPFDRIAAIEWNAIRFDRSLRVENVLCLPRSIDYHNVGHMLCMHARPHRRKV